MRVGKGRDRLTARQARFVTEYLKDFNATAAAKRAGFSTNSSTGSKLLVIPKVAAEVRRQCLIIEQRLTMSADDVHRGLCRIASDPREPREGGPSWEARISALTQLGKILGLYTSRLEVRGSMTLVDLLMLADRKTDEASAGAKHLGDAIKAHPSNEVH